MVVYLWWDKSGGCSSSCGVTGQKYGGYGACISISSNSILFVDRNGGYGGCARRLAIAPLSSYEFCTSRPTAKSRVE